MTILNNHKISIAFQTDKPFNQYGSLARQVENFGFDGVTVYNDMLYQPAWLPLLEIARYTNKIRIGPAAVNPFTCHPINIAGNIAILDECSQGRAYLGLARGAWLDYVGLQPKHPTQQLKEAMMCIRHLLKQSTDPYPSSYFPLAGGDSLRWKILRSKIPFLIGTWGPKTIQACIHEITEVKLGGTANPDVVPWIKTHIINATSKIGRDSAEVGVVIGAVSVVDQDGDKARALARKEVALYLPVVASLDPTLKLDRDVLESVQKATSRYDFNEASEYIDDKLLQKFAFAGTPKDLINQTIDLFRAGASRVEFGTPHGLTPETGLQLLGGKVLPRVKEHLATI